MNRRRGQLKKKETGTEKRDAFGRNEERKTKEKKVERLWRKTEYGKQDEEDEETEKKRKKKNCTEKNIHGYWKKRERRKKIGRKIECGI